jgi:hypothetical protein
MSRADDLIVRQMGYSLREFASVLPLAMRDWQVRGGPTDWQVEDRAGERLARITIRSLPDRAMGRLRLPVIEVTLDLQGAGAAVRQEFLRRFDRGFHRGGG